MNIKSNIPKAKIDKGWNQLQENLDIVMPVHPNQKRRPLAFWWSAAAAIVIIITSGVLYSKLQQNRDIETNAGARQTGKIAESSPSQNVHSHMNAAAVQESNEKSKVNPKLDAALWLDIPVITSLQKVISNSNAQRMEEDVATSSNLIQLPENKLIATNTAVLHILPATSTSTTSIHKAEIALLPTHSPPSGVDNNSYAISLPSSVPPTLKHRGHFRFGLAAELDMASDNRINGYQVAFMIDLLTHKKLGLRTGIGLRQLQFENNRNLVIPVSSSDLHGYTTNVELLDAFDPQSITTSTHSKNKALPYVRRLTRIELPINLRYSFGSRWVASAGINTVYTFDITAKSGELSFLNSFTPYTEQVANNAFNRIASKRYEVWSLDYSFGIEYRLARCLNLGINWQQSIGENDTFKSNKRLNILGIKGIYFFD